MSMEKLINRMQYNFNLSSFPAIIFLNMYAVLEGNYTLLRGQAARDIAEKCIRNGSACPSLCPDNFVGLPLAGNNATIAEIVTNRVATHYGFASLSYTNLIAALLQSPARGNLSECQVYATVFGDPIHPNYQHGRTLLSDLLVSYLAGAHDHFHSNQKVAETLSHIYYQEHHGVAPLLPWSLMVPWMQCYGTRQGINGDEAGLESSPEINVVKAEGWIYVETDGGKPKPGWVSTIPGSELWMAIDTDFDRLTDHIVSMSLLSSYEHMGQAEVACISGCRCDTSRIDGHVPDHKHSIPKLHAFRLFQYHPGSNGHSDNSSSSTGSSRCVIQVKVLQESGSGEHKVKVMQLAIMTMVNVSSALPHE